MEVKINAPEILEEEIKKKPVGSVFLSTVTDPYNPLEAKYQITRKCLKILIGNFRPISILTKSNLVLRDLDLFKESTQKVEVGFTLTTLDDRIARIIEPTASVPSERIKALAIFRQAGIRTYAFIGPVLPQLTDLSAIFSALREKVDEIWIDTLNIKGENWQGLKKKIGRHWPNLIPLYKEIFFKNRREYENQLQQEAKKLGRFYKMSIKISF
jgi:DNA repair photolyase